MAEEAYAGFLPDEDGGRDLAATLAALPALFTAFGSALTGLAGWAEDFKPARGSAGAIAEMAGKAAACAQAAQAASDAYRRENEFWLGAGDAGQPDRNVLSLTEQAGGGFIPDGSYTPGYQLADTLTDLPGLFDAIGDNLGLLAEWMSDRMMATTGESASLVAELSDTVCVLSVAAETAVAVYQRDNSFWLDAREH
jgi:hypothetical protein